MIYYWQNRTFMLWSCLIILFGTKVYIKEKSQKHN